jgi:hypothetical protein
MRKYHLKLGTLIALLLFIIILMTTSGCGTSVSGNSGGYAAFKFPDDDIRFKLKGTLIHEHPLFTFEYPLSFTKENDQDEILLNMRVTKIDFTRQVPGSADSFPKTTLSASVHEPGLWSDTDAKTTITNIISYHVHDPDFKVLETSTATIAGMQAEYLSYSFHSPAKEGFGYAPIPAYNGLVKFACFDYENFIWRVYLSCLEEEAAETEAYFQRLIDTFQILE